jgi:hypothetical protein
LGTTTVDGTTVFIVDKPCAWVRVNVTALTLGSATSLSVFVTATSGV